MSDVTSTWGSPQPSDADSGGAQQMPRSLKRGTTLGRYVLVDLLGRGGMGAVYSAYDTQLQRRVALKLLHRGRPHATADQLFAEARALAQLRHPNVVAVHDVSEVDGFVFLAMDLVEGVTLRRWAEEHEELTARIELLADCARGLAAVHRAGLLHRDVKPTNIVVDVSEPSPRPIVVDFGLAAPDDGDPTAGSDPERSASAPVWAGTPAYMAPECFDGVGGPFSDQWSFAMTCAEVVAGQRPTRASIEEGALAIPSAAVQAVIARGLAADPATRWPNLDAMADAMVAAVRPRSSTTWRIAGGLLLLAVAGVGVLATPSDSCGPEAARTRQAIIDDAAIAQIRVRAEAVEATVAERFATQMDTWSAAWESSYAQACRAEQLESAVGWCLQDAATQVGALVSEAAGARVDDRGLFRLSGVLPRLGDPSQCTDPIFESRPHPTASERERFTESRTELVQAAALELLGRYDAAAAAAERAWAAVAEAPPVIQAPVAQRRASIAQRAGELDIAASHGTTAMQLAAEAKDDWLVATAALDLAETMSAQGRVDALRQHMTYAEIAVNRATESPPLRARLEFAFGRFHEVALDDAASLAAHQRAFEIRSETMPGSLYVADSRVNLGALLGKTGRFDEALQHLEAALQAYRARLGDVHPILAHACVVRGLTLHRASKTSEAIEAMRTCLPMIETTLGPDAEKAAFANISLGAMHGGLGDYPAAEAAFRRALRIRIKALGPDHPETGIAHNNLGSVLAAMEEPEAREHLERAEAITIAAHGEDSPRLAFVLSGLAQLAEAEADYAAARDLLLRSIAITTKAHGAEHPNLVIPLLNLAQLQAELKDRHAMATYERVEALLARTEGHPLQAVVDTGVGQLLVERGSVSEALVRLDAAVAVTRDGEPLANLAANARFARAKAWRADGNADTDPVAGANDALARLPDDADPELRREIEDWLRTASSTPD